MQQSIAVCKGLKRIWMMFVIILLLILLGFSARAGVSYVVQYRAHAAINLWQKSLDNKPSLAVWQDMLDSVKGMLDVDAGNPVLYNVQARLYFYRARNMDVSAQQSSQDYKQAMQGYRTVIAARPAWPYAYLSLLYSKILAHELDAEMVHSLLSVIKLSPWEKASLSDTVKAAVFVWSSLDAESRQIVKSYLLRVSDKRKGEVVLALKESRLTEYFCKNIAKNEAVSVCQ